MAEHHDATSADKAALRLRLRALRGQLLPGSEAAIRTQVALVLEGPLAGAGRVGLYWPLAGEVDLRPLADQPALASRLALPAVAGNRLLYRPWHAAQALHRDACGIPAPPPSAGDLAAGELALLLVPALAVDRRGLRLGYGGGWYDRLRSRPDWRRVPALAVLPSGCLLERLHADPWDVPFDGWICERGLGRPLAQAQGGPSAPASQSCSQTAPDPLGSDATLRGSRPVHRRSP
ncbi:5-formyltetrahydrofolate cyclo-ligase [Cyanobium sp. ATX 6A2]|uniref:5-formyltetrahydrofolate cyclo-ligase n=1 Tax=Cyanobium sp. ATX 6A2 TaxID=2823700 RepID=UPI0020CB6BAC|nr:5-formyltetrahydrofolate cyclo-ligase [Cyanobium sp. ATX 6A2]MCP9886544.1 5-formyltetrahydrofolate cyclo-ligase [Cyanobium sp. ATX 6A2]